jgi:CheY-like chemotaxis protein
MAHAVNVLVGEMEYALADLRSAKERAEEANRAKTVFLRNVSHEIRTPLSAILGMAQLLRSSNGRRDDLEERIVANSRLLLGLVDELLDLSKVESGKLDVDSQPVWAPRAVAEVLSALEPQAEEKGLSFGFDVAADGHHMALADAKRVRQILMNVIGNAIKFTEEGEVRVRLIDEPPHLHVEISDTGIGLSPAQAEVLFEPFAQADATISRRFGGTGLGLAVSRRLARAMGGDLAVSAGGLGVGTTVRLSLVREKESSPRSSPRPAEDGFMTAELRGLRVLLAEDNEDVRSSTTEILTILGATVIEATDGIEAVALCERERHTIDVVLMDMRMPRLDGIEATRELRKQGFPVPIIAVTADAILEHRKECLAVGCSAQVTKPVDVDELIAVIREFWTPDQRQR